MVDLTGRLFIIEPKDAERWTSSKAHVTMNEQTGDHIKAGKEKQTSESVQVLTNAVDASNSDRPAPEANELHDIEGSHYPQSEEEQVPPLTPLEIIIRLSGSTRAMSVILLTFIYGYVLCLYEDQVYLVFKVSFSLHKSRPFPCDFRRCGA